MAHLLLEVYGCWHQFKCSYSLLWLKSLLQNFTQLLNTAFDRAAWASSPQGLRHCMSNSGRKRKVDEEFFRSDLPPEGGRPSKRMKRQRGLNGDGDDNYRRAAIQRQMLAYSSEICRWFSSEAQLCVCHDASMVSGEDTLLFALWSHNQGKGCWLPLQVSWALLADTCQSFKNARIFQI